VYLSRELAKLGWQVTVYNDRDDEYDDNGVLYKPWTLLNPYDEFDVFVAWRNPSLPRALGLKARKVLVDLHDTPVGHQTITKADVPLVDKFMFKTKFQTGYTDIVPEDKIAVVPNGLVLSQFEDEAPKRPHSVGWFSSYDRGLDTLLSIWPKIQAAVPDVTLDVAYGWRVFDLFHSKNAERMKWKWSMIREFNKYGVKEHGRLSHTELADLMQTTQVLAYPTSFPEIDCITVKKAQAAKMDVVTSGYAALQESIIKDEEEIEGIHEKPEELDKFADRLIEALLNPVDDKRLEKTKQAIFAKYDWGSSRQGLG
jgi:glycosyltransferase involved in cell wall biosynthesis